MTRLLSQQDLARLHIRLEVPIHIASLLDQGEALIDDEIFCLESQIAQMSPIDALVTFGCCLQVLANYMKHDPLMEEMFQTQSNFILDDYAPLWLKAKKARKVPSVPMDWTNHMAEDFEAVAELLGLSLDAVNPSDPAFENIITILMRNAVSYAAHVYQEPEEESVLPPILLGKKSYEDNVIAFPRTRQ